MLLSYKAQPEFLYGFMLFHLNFHNEAQNQLFKIVQHISAMKTIVLGL